MHRRDVLVAALEAHRAFDRTERRHQGRVLAFARQHEDPFDRALAEGHVTGSALVVSPDRTHVLLVHHDALDRWIQPGGHAEPTDDSPLAVCLREAQEETGLEARPHPGWPHLFDVDVHTIPESATAPEHLHYDVRYLLVTDPAAPLGRGDDGVRAVGWFDLEEARAKGHGVGLERMLDKVLALPSARRR